KEENVLMKKLKKLISTFALPIGAFVLLFLIWQFGVELIGVPAFLFPRPTDIIASAIENYASLCNAVIRTISASMLGFLMSVVVCIAGSILLASSNLVQRSLYPYAVLLQTVLIVVIAPIIVIWFGSGLNAIVIIAFIIGFFPMLSNTLVG